MVEGWRGWERVDGSVRVRRKAGGWGGYVATVEFVCGEDELRTGERHPEGIYTVGGHALSHT